MTEADEKEAMGLLETIREAGPREMESRLWMRLVCFVERMRPMPDLVACRCGSQREHPRIESYPAAPEPGKLVYGRYGVSCPSCGRRGPKAAKKEEAILGWNEDMRCQSS